MPSFLADASNEMLQLDARENKLTLITNKTIMLKTFKDAKYHMHCLAQRIARMGLVATVAPPSVLLSPRDQEICINSNESSSAGKSRCSPS